MNKRRWVDPVGKPETKPAGPVKRRRRRRRRSRALGKAPETHSVASGGTVQALATMLLAVVRAEVRSVVYGLGIRLTVPGSGRGRGRGKLLAALLVLGAVAGRADALTCVASADGRVVYCGEGSPPDLPLSDVPALNGVWDRWADSPRNKGTTVVPLPRTRDPWSDEGDEDDGEDEE